MFEIVRRAGSELSAEDLHRLLYLRIGVLVVEQGLAYADVDGLDLLPSTVHFWTSAGPEATSCLRIVVDGSDLRVGRVCTSRDHRRQGLSVSLLRASVAAFPKRKLIVDGQTRIADLYRQVGFSVDGEEFLENGIPHLHMRRDPSSSGPK